MKLPACPECSHEQKLYRLLFLQSTWSDFTCHNCKRVIVHDLASSIARFSFAFIYFGMLNAVDYFINGIFGVLLLPSIIVWLYVFLTVPFHKCDRKT